MNCQNKPKRNHLAFAIGAGALSLLAAFIGRQLLIRARNAETRHRLSEMLDGALIDSMDCSDPVAKY